MSHKTRMYFGVNVVHFIHWSLSDVDENFILWNTSQTFVIKIILTGFLS